MRKKREVRMEVERKKRKVMGRDENKYKPSSADSFVQTKLKFFFQVNLTL